MPVSTVDIWETDSLCEGSLLTSFVLVMYFSSVFFLVVGFVGIFVQGVLLKVMNDALGEKMVLIFSFLVGAGHDIVYSLAKTKTAIYVSAVLASLLMMAFPTISAVKSNNVNESEQGRIQGALYSVQALSSALGPTMFRAVHHFTSENSIFGPGSMFLFSACMYVIASYVACLLPVSTIIFLGQLHDTRHPNHSCSVCDSRK